MYRKIAESQRPVDLKTQRFTAIPFNMSGAVSAFFFFAMAVRCVLALWVLQRWLAILALMDIERIIDDIEQLEEMF